MDKEPLIENTTEEQPSNEQSLSKVRQWAMLSTTLSLMILSLCVDTMIYPFFPAIATEKGLSNTEIGVVFSSYDFFKFVSSPMFGSLLIKWHPKSMCTFGNVITTIAGISFGTANAIVSKELFLGVCLLIRSAAGVGSAMIVVAATSILLKSTSFEPSTIAGVIEVANGLGFVVGPVVGAVLFELMGYAGMFCFLGGIMLSFIPVFVVVVPKVVEYSVKERRGFISMFTIPGCLLVFVHCVITSLNATAWATGMSEFLMSTFGVSPAVVGLLLAVWSMVYVACGAVTTKVISQRNTFHMMLIGWCIMSIVIPLIGPTALLDFLCHGNKIFWLTVVAFSAVHMALPLLYIPPMQAALDQAHVNGYDKDSLHTYGMITGLVNCGISLGRTVSPIIGGAITDDLDFTWTMTCFTSTDVVMAILMFSFLLYMKCIKQPLYISSEVSDDVSDRQDDQKEAVRQQINDACADRMNKCLSNPKGLTTTYEQQPLIE